MKPLTSTDDARILQHCLHDGSKTCKEVADSIGISHPRYATSGSIGAEAVNSRTGFIAHAPGGKRTIEPLAPG
jgi:hypothetical protein